MCNQTPIDWFPDKQNTVETATDGSEFNAVRITVDQIVDLQGALRYLGVPIDVKAYMFGDNQSVVTRETLAHSKLNKILNALNLLPTVHFSARPDPIVTSGNAHLVDCQLTRRKSYQVSLVWFDFATAVMTLSGFRSAPKQGKLRLSVSFLQMRQGVIRFQLEELDFSDIHGRLLQSLIESACKGCRVLQ